MGSSNNLQICPRPVTEPDFARTQAIVNDVFVNYSFDTGKNFSAYLIREIGCRGFLVLDHTRLSLGNHVSSELWKAIQQSGIYLLIFSANYAVDERCLDELVNVMDCIHNLDHRKVLPVYFTVKPSDVKNQSGPYKKAFKDHETKNKYDLGRVQKWRNALKDAGGLVGLAFKDGWDEAEFVAKVVKELSRMQNPQELHVAYHDLVGITPRVERLISCLNMGSGDVIIVAVLGIGGIGKTTVVKVTFNNIAREFDACCYLEGIHERCVGPTWKVDLQKELISCLDRYQTHPMIFNHNDGVTRIRKLISLRKVLLVVDDVSKHEQLQALGIHPPYFHHGSRIIVTTRVQPSLGTLLYTPYHAESLDHVESLQLFNRLTFGNEDFVNQMLVSEIALHADGLPLVLEVWSGYFSELNREEWAIALEKLKRIPHKDVYQKLKISYDSLETSEQKLFLDIACFFDDIKYKKDIIVKVLHDEELSSVPIIDIQKLHHRSLVTIDECYGVYSYVSMHRAIRDMGKEIVRRENEDEPGQRTRLHDEMDVRRVMRECSGTESVESIRFGLRDGDLFAKVEAIRKMSNLRLIELDTYIPSIGSNDEMPPPLSFKKLKYLKWRFFPFKCINIDMPNVVVLKLQGSKLEILWEGLKSLKKLKVLEVSNSLSLTKTGDFYGLENLEELMLYNCWNLEELHSSVGCLNKLVELDLRGCKRLQRFPFEAIGKLQSLQYLNLNECPITAGMHSIPNLPPHIEGIEAENCTSLPSNMSDEKYLQTLMFTGLTNLRSLSMRSCGISQLTGDIGNLLSLKNLDLSKNKFSRIPKSINNLSKLKKLDINDCSKLRRLPLLPSCLEYINAIGCRSLDVMSFLSMQEADISRCPESVCSNNLANELSRKVLQVYKKSSFISRLEIKLEDRWSKVLPSWCHYRSRGRSLSFVAPPHLDKKIYGIILCSKKFSGPTLLNKTKGTIHKVSLYQNKYVKPMHCKFYPLDNTTLVVEAGDTIVVSYPYENEEKVHYKYGEKVYYKDGKEWGLCLIYDVEEEDPKIHVQDAIQPSL